MLNITSIFPKKSGFTTKNIKILDEHLAMLSLPIDYLHLLALFYLLQILTF